MINYINWIHKQFMSMTCPPIIKQVFQVIVFSHNLSVDHHFLARNALTLVVESCKAALIAIDNSDEPAQDNYPSSDFPTLRKDFLSLLSLIHASSTKVALALKPSSPQYKAALTPLKDLSKNVAALIHSILLMRRDQSATILKEYTSLVQNVIGAVESLAHIFLDSSATATDEYLVRTGTIHDLIDMARKPGGLSMISRDAVRKKWLQNHESIVDGAEEIQQLCSPKDTKDDDDFIDDGWEELGINPTKLSHSELDRTEKVGSPSFPSLNNGHPRFTIHLLGTSSYQVCSTVAQTCSSRCAFSRYP